MSELVKTVINLYTNFITSERRKNKIRIFVIAILLSLFLFISKFFFNVKYTINLENSVVNLINGVFNLYANGIYIVFLLAAYFFMLWNAAMGLSIVINRMSNFPFINTYYIDIYENLKLDILYKNFKKIFKRFYINIWPFIFILYLLTNNIKYNFSYPKTLEMLINNFSLFIIIALNSIYVLKDLSHDKEHGINYEEDFYENFTVISESDILYDNTSYAICFSNKNKIKLYYIFEIKQGYFIFTLLRSFYDYDEAKSVFIDMCENVKYKNKEYEENKPKKQSPPKKPSDIM